MEEGWEVRSKEGKEREDVGIKWEGIERGEAIMQLFTNERVEMGYTTTHQG